MSRMKNLTLMSICMALFLLSASAMFAQQGGVASGVVLSAADGSPVIGASVLNKGTNQGAVTGLDGAFSVNCSPSDVLEISCIGFETLQIQGPGQGLVIRLKEDTRALDEVVVVAYGSVKKVNLTGSISTMSSEEINNRPVAQTSQLLQGKMPGVTVTSSFNIPGSDAASIKVRGINTLNSTSPVVIIDGIEGSINDIATNDIESLTVLKDAASSAIYGSRAANGVILVTTKTGKRGERFTATYNGMCGLQFPTTIPDMVDGETYMRWKNIAEVNEGRLPLYSEADIANYKSNLAKNDESAFDTDWYGAVMKKNAVMHQHTFSVKGGTEKISSYASVNYLDQKGLIDNVDYNRISVRTNTTYQVSKRLQFRLNAFLRRSTQVQPHEGVGEMFRMMAEIPPIYPAMWSDGTVGEGWQGNNPLGYIYQGGLKTSVSSRVLLNLGLKYDFTDWLNLSVQYSPKYLTTDTKDAVKHFTYRRIDGSEDQRPVGLNSFSNSNSHSLENFYQSLLNLHKDFKHHSVALLLGFEANDYRSDDFSATRQNYEFPQFEVLDCGDKNYQSNSGSATEWALMSFFGRVNYSFLDRYLFEANLRYDGSSRFASDRRWGLFPSFSFGWRIDQEPFMKNVNWLSALKLRLSYGSLGNQSTGNYGYQSSIELDQYYYLNKAVVPGAAQTVLANREITWETSIVKNIGLDFGFFRNRLSGSLDVYKKNTIDILYDRPIPGVMGLYASDQNVAEVQNIGWDFQLNWQDRIGDFNYGIDLVLSDVHNKVVDLDGLPQKGRNVLFEGEEYHAIRGYRALGIYRTEADLEKYPAINNTVRLGDLIYEDVNPDGVIDDDDKQIIGSSIPRWNYGLTFNFGWKALDLSVFIQGIGKKDLYYVAGGARSYGGSFQTFQADTYNAEDPATVNARWPRFSGLSNNREDSSFWVFDSSYLRVKNVSLGYQLPAKLINKVGISKTRFYVTGENLFTWDRLPIPTLDPESPSSTSGPNYYPLTKTLVFGVDITF